ncbi:conserved hypothetical protein [Denitrovibrio acetiphilus DSM 12809]|jgi:hypothetical protein|uniref:Uncharacterized protein n=1 Tax=Denitrovibrio acetiphilus (strain DSM 12809 / NBRC 114555 / N2460) TaxID=522772 RepID=D4H1I6_DENA2|nr:hypothetical protein [Denitrovibrio acetiphilus]ADD68237.1 conserved hypothetical protein [Denitrovibrio acetiphilus DSM 12809]ADD68746.1 conserved hypothetical protein [Denitrovibrio acetiphilus DSM 12809]
MMNRYSIQIFAEVELRDYLEQKKASIVDSIEKESDDYLLNVNEVDYIKYKTEEAKIEPLKIHVDQIYASSSEQMIPAEYFPNTFFVRQGEKYKKDVIRFHMPFSGNSYLLKCKPSTRILWSTGIEISGQEFTFEIINFSNDVAKITIDKDSKIRDIMKQLVNVTKDIDQYNSGIETQVKNAFDSRKKKILSKNNILASLGVPIKKATNVPQTFAVPTQGIRKKIPISRPQVHEAGYTPEPSLDLTTYNSILKLIHDVGKEFERLPSLYCDKEEEHLRDHFLMMLEPNFEGSATGETFNKKGKTDILLRHDGKNVFIAECKFWKGSKAFLDTISQLLGYLSWRDSKAAVIMFVQNKDFTSVLNSVKVAVTEHPNFIELKVMKDETWLNCTVHLNGDRNRLVYLAVMLYHLPK